MSFDRDTKTDEIELIKDPVLRAQREAENGVRQFRAARKIIGEYIAEPGPRPLKQWMIMDLHLEAMNGIHPLAGTFRNSIAEIGTADHIPPRSSEIPEYFSEMCSYINDNWEDRSAVYLSAFMMWRLNWIHPFADGNGRTSRVVSYLILSMKMQSILPGSPTIPEQIDDENGRREEYYAELEKADEAYKQNGRYALSSMEQMIEGLLQIQISNGIKAAGL